MAIKGIKFFRVGIVFISCYLVTNNPSTAESFFSSLFILTAGYAYDYYNFMQTTKKNSGLIKIFGLIAFSWSFISCVFSICGLLNIVTVDFSTLMLTSKNWLIPDSLSSISLEKLSKLIIYPFMVFAGVECLCGRNDSIDKIDTNKEG